MQDAEHIRLADQFVEVPGGANANNYLVEVDDKFLENDGFQVLPDNIMLYEPGFLTFLDYRRKHQRDFYEDNANKESFSEAFREYAKAEIEYCIKAEFSTDNSGTPLRGCNEARYSLVT